MQQYDILMMIECINLVSWKTAILIPDLSKALQADSNPPFLPLRMFHVAMVMSPLSSVRDDASVVREQVVAVTSSTKVDGLIAKSAISHVTAATWVH